MQQKSESRQTTPSRKTFFGNVLETGRAFRLRARHVVSRRKLLVAGAAAGGTLTVFLAVSFFLPGSLRFSVAGETCAFNPLILPRLHQHRPSGTFLPEARGGLRIAGYPIFSSRTCLKAAQAPVGGQVETAKISWLHIPFLQKKVTVTTDPLPDAQARFDSAQGISSGGRLDFLLEKTDSVFTYAVAGNSKTTDCTLHDRELQCELGPLTLAQGTPYDLSLHRRFADEAQDEVFRTNITTLDPVIIVSSTVEEGGTVYDVPDSLSITANKALKSADSVRLRNTATEEEVSGLSYTLTNTALVVSFAEPLPRESALELSVGQLEATDGSSLEAPYSLRFETSGGPKVSSTSIRNAGVQPGSNVVLSFDVGLQPGQDLRKLARIEVGGKPVNTSVSLSGNKVTINPAADLPRCTIFRVIVDAGLVSEHGVGGGYAWNMQSRTICQVPFSIGRSVQGRVITGYRFGSGASKIVFIGGLHGDEKSSVATMNGLVAYLEENFEQIPGHRSIYVIPNANPDGYAKNSRTNANGVDLNRNFPTGDWQSSVQMPGGVTAPTGGGTSAGDQPETQALMSFIRSQQPRLVLTYHAVATTVLSNDFGDSIPLGQKYAKDSRYRFSTAANYGSVFNYATTGEFEDWVGESKGIPALLIEQSSRTANQFAAHRTAILNIIKIP